MPELRDFMPALQNKVYFNYGGQGPLPTPSLEEIKASWVKIQELGPFSNDVWPYLAAEIQKTREKLASACGVPPNRLALTENVTTGCVLPIWGLPFKNNDRLLISDCEHPGVIGACKELAARKKLAIDTLPVSEVRHGINESDKTISSVLDILKRCLRPNTRLVVISHLLWNTGQIMPIEAISNVLSSHPQKPFFLVDGAQSFFQIPINSAAEKADIYAFTGHKWACGPEGLGGVALSERALSESRPTFIGWRSLKHEGNSDVLSENLFHKDSRKFEIATSCIPLLAGLRCSLELLEKEGSPLSRSAKILELSSKLWNEIKALNDIEPLLKGPPPSGLVSFQMHNKVPPAKIVKDLRDNGICLRAIETPISLRACLHVTSNAKDLQVLLKTLASLNKEYR